MTIAYADDGSSSSNGRSGRPTVVIVGAGLAGLSAAFGLRTRLGRRVEIVVLEAKSALGGRSLSSSPADALGGEPAFLHEGPLLRMAEALGLTVRKEEASTPDVAFHSEGRWIRSSQWSKHAEGMSPADVWSSIAARYPRPKRWETNPVAALADVAPNLLIHSVADLLRSEDVPRELWPFVCTRFQVFDEPERVGALSALIREWSRPSGDTRYALEGSPTDLVEAAAEIPDAVHLDARVTAVHMTDGRHRVTAADGRTWDAELVVFAVPPAEALAIDVSPGWPRAMSQALETCRQGPVIRVALETTPDAWDDDGLPPTMLADRGFNACVPTDESEALGLEMLLVGDRARALHTRAEVGVSMSDEAVAMLTLARPATEGHVHAEGCTVDVSNAGALPYFPPLADVPEMLIAMQRECRGRYIAGEHTDVRHVGCDGAVDSGLRVAHRIADSLDPTVTLPLSRAG